MQQRKKHSSVSTPRNQPKGKYCQYERVKSAITELNLDLKNIVGKTFDRAANMNGVHKGLEWKSTMTQIEQLGSVLGIIQALCNFLEASLKRHVLFSDTWYRSSTR